MAAYARRLRPGFSTILASSHASRFHLLGSGYPRTTRVRPPGKNILRLRLLTTHSSISSSTRRRCFLLIWGVCELRASSRKKKGRPALGAAKAPRWSRIFPQREREVHCSQKRRAFASVNRIRLDNGTKATDRLEMEIPMTRCPSELFITKKWLQ